MGSYPTFSPLPNALHRNRRAPGFPQACRRGASITGGLIFCGTFRSRARSSVAAIGNFQRSRQPPGVTRRVALSSPHSCELSDYWSPDFPPVRPACAEQTGDHPTHPLPLLYGITTVSEDPIKRRDELSAKTWTARDHAARKANKLLTVENRYRLPHYQVDALPDVHESDGLRAPLGSTFRQHNR